MIYQKDKMILVKKLTSKEILEVVGVAAAGTIPKGLEGKLNLSWDNEGGIEIYFIEGKKKKSKTLEKSN